MERIEGDAELAERLAYCVPLGIPLSIFTGRELPGPGEPQWDDDDRAAALAWRRWEAQRCPSCGTRRQDWWDDAGRPRMDPPLEAITDRCGGCHALELARDSIAEGEGKGVHVRFRAAPPPDRR